MILKRRRGRPAWVRVKYPCHVTVTMHADDAAAVCPIHGYVHPGVTRIALAPGRRDASIRDVAPSDEGC